MVVVGPWTSTPLTNRVIQRLSSQDRAKTLAGSYQAAHGLVVSADSKDHAINKLLMNHLETPPKGLHGKSKDFVKMRVYILRSKEKKRMIWYCLSNEWRNSCWNISCYGTRNELWICWNMVRRWPARLRPASSPCTCVLKSWGQKSQVMSRYKYLTWEIWLKAKKMSYITKCQCFKSYFSEVDVKNPITAKPHVYSPVIAIISVLIWYYKS